LDGPPNDTFEMDTGDPGRLSELGLCTWLGSAAPGEQFPYHRGSLARDRDPVISRLNVKHRAELCRLARRAYIAAERGLADLVQRRNDSGDFTYLLVARRRSSSSPDLRRERKVKGG
jgi:hypothetical protein